MEKRSIISRTITHTPFGQVLLEEQGGFLIKCVWTTLKESAYISSKQTSLIKTTIKQLDEYFQKKRHFFDLPYLPNGSELQKSAWKILGQIPYGETRSYKQIACQINKPEAIRAVASAIGKNPLCLVIPCHRVIRHSGEAGNYAGGAKRKSALLELEYSAINHYR